MILTLGSNKKSTPHHQTVMPRARYGRGSGCRCCEGIRKAYEKHLVAEERKRTEA